MPTNKPKEITTADRLDEMEQVLLDLSNFVGKLSKTVSAQQKALSKLTQLLPSTAPPTEEEVISKMEAAGVDWETAERMIMEEKYEVLRQTEETL